MLSTASRAAGGLARSLLAAVCGAAGTVVGAAVGLLSGFVNEEGLLQGTFVGAIIGAIVSVEVADSLVRIWCCDDCSMDARIKRTRLVLRNIGLGRVLRGSAFPSMSSALDGQMDALQLHHHHYGGAGRSVDIFELEPSSSSVMAARRAAVEGLPSTTLTKETAAQHATCPICLHVSQHSLTLCLIKLLRSIDVQCDGFPDKRVVSVFLVRRPGVPGRREREEAAGVRPRVPSGVHRWLAAREAPVPDVPPRRLLAY